MKGVIPGWWLLLLLLAHGLAQASWDGSDAEAVSLSGRWALLYDPQKRLALADLETRAVAARFVTQSGHPGLGYRSGVVWLRLELERPHAAIPIWWLELQSPTLDTAILYQRRADGSFRQAVAGDQRASRDQDVHYRNPLFRLELPEGQTSTVYLRLESRNPISFAMLLWPPERFVSAVNELLLLHGLILAAFVLLILSNLWLYVASRDTTFALFSLFTLANLLTMLGNEGYLPYYLLGGLSGPKDLLSTLTWIWAPVFGAGFQVHYLGLLRIPELAGATRWGLGAGEHTAGGAGGIAQHAVSRVGVAPALPELDAAVRGGAAAARRRPGHAGLAARAGAGSGASGVLGDPGAADGPQPGLDRGRHAGR